MIEKIIRYEELLNLGAPWVLKEEDPLKFDCVVEELFCWLFLFLKTI